MIGSYIKALILLISILFDLSLLRDIIYSDRYNRDNLRKVDKDKRVLVIVPYKGIDRKMEDNIIALKSQSYKNYDIVAVVDSKNDPALSYIRRYGLKYLIAKNKIEDTSGKVNALIYALKKYKSSRYYAFVIADSDVYPKKNWLESLVNSLESKHISTTYPYFMPLRGFWSDVKHVWNFIGFSLMSSDKTRFGWGGSLAFPNLYIEELIDQLYHKKSDDITITKFYKSKGMKINYIADISYVYISESFGSFIEWSIRQTVWTIYANRYIFYYGIIYYVIFEGIFIYSLYLLLIANPIGLLLLTPKILSILRAERITRISKIKTAYIMLFINLIYIYDLLVAYNKKEIMWRGSIYKIKE
ncbi:MAG: glycosyl transferase family 2 [Candidatus Micrarchaeota archaeon]|nr:MAG: glycosyl transferase family 2 [Candidatus Micrarchaeota archaeon]